MPAVRYCGIVPDYILPHHLGVRRYVLDENGLLDEKSWSWQNVNAHHTVNIATIHGEDKDLKFLHIAYSGPDALKAFHQDFEQFSCVRDVAVAQLFGYNDGQFALPALIFYDALVPVAHIFE
ncbi:hypothetical protein Moror_15862 [Moniliophthora roreri MCA 2997]|uniref:Uncharacterized protein n=1 Tax=Moniliophthora roreri (strain MCA 2997) TaxID=1381753 RepID=V2WNB5_MONRO|nr:hypothetical protein Moror_15862 [Moniliophthora roreri MCA 2997]